MAHRISVSDKCIGCGACVATCPDSFEMGSDGKAKPKISEVDEITCEKDAEAGCPVGAIKVS